MKRSQTNVGGATDDMIRVLLNDGGAICAVLRNDDDKM
jgi:hypothetical protein